MDQAHGLRLIAQNASDEDLKQKITHLPKPLRVISVTSGKGGVGKTNLVVNLAVALQALGNRVIVLDADLGLANIDVLLGLNPRYNLGHAITEERSIEDIMVEGPGGIRIIPGATGIPDLADLGDFQREKIIESLSSLDSHGDVLLIDTGAGLSKNVRNFVIASDEAIVISTPDPASITDAYSMVKVLLDENPDLKLQLVVNIAKTKYEAQEVNDRMVLVVKQFLNKYLETLGYIIEDRMVVRAVRKQQPVILAFPNCEASYCIRSIANKIVSGEKQDGQKGGMRSFLARLFKGGSAGA
jgi:flagellar biosynthesis protein FlhG